MKEGFKISIYFDKRNTKSNNKYPIKLRVYNTLTQKQKLYATNFELSNKEYQSILLNQNPRGENKEIRMQINALEIEAINIAKCIQPFKFKEFEKKIFRNKGDGINLYYHYNLTIEEYLKENRIGTAESYKCSLKSLKTFFNKKFNKKIEEISFYDINEKLLLQYEKFMIENGKSYSTVGIYLRNLRAIFNNAIREKEIEVEIYPFGKSKYQIPTTKRTKRALNKDELKKLYFGVPKNIHQKKAKDFWFLSYNLNGMNLKDIALLKYSNIKGEYIFFIREKTKKTSKSNQKEISVFINDYIKNFISTYGKVMGLKDDFIFNIISRDDNEDIKRTKIKNFNKYINQHIKLLSKSIGLENTISFVWARHSFATFSVNKGASLELMQQSLGHQNIKTTESYFAGFENETIREMSNNLMEFKN